MEDWSCRFRGEKRRNRGGVLVDNTGRCTGRTAAMDHRAGIVTLLIWAVCPRHPYEGRNFIAWRRRTLVKDRHF